MTDPASVISARMERSRTHNPADRRRDVKRPSSPSGRSLMTRFLTSGDICDYFVEVERGHPQIAHTRLLRDHVYLLTDPDWIVEVFLTRGRDTMKGPALQGAKALLGTGLLTSEGDFHLRQRRLVQPAFHRERIASYAAVMARLAEQHEARWTDGVEVDIAAEMSALTLAVVGETLFGADLTGDASEVGAALEGVMNASGTRFFISPQLLRVPVPGRRRALDATARLDAVVQRLIDEHRRDGDRGDMLSLLIAAQEDGVGMDDEQVRDEAMTLVLAGHETTAMTLTWTWLLLARNVQAREWLYEELDGLAGRTPGFDDLLALPRSRAVIAEAIRLYPPAWSLGRRLLTDVQLGEWTLPRGSVALSSQYAMQRSPRWWDSPLAFRPERWIDADGSFSETAPGQPRGAWFPFGWGNRRCIGEQFAWTEAQLVLATLAQRWNPQVVPGRPVELQTSLTLRPKNGLPMVLHAR